MTMIPLALIEPDPENVRRSAAGEAADAQLRASMESIGLVQPLAVRWKTSTTSLDGYTIVAGHRRFATAKALGWEEIECRVLESDDPLFFTSAQLAENVVRQDMSALDIFEAVERLAAGGLGEASIAVQLNVTEKRVRQMRAMGSLHPDLVAHMRKHGNLPSNNDMQVICQAPHALQAEAFTACQKKAGKNGTVDWWQVARGCHIEAIPLKHARFDRALYKGPVKVDLFASEETEEASSPSLFLKLQQAWLADERQRRGQEGFHIIEGTIEYGSLKRPKECDPDWKDLKTKLPAPKARKEWAYVAAMADDGRVQEQLYRLKVKAEKPKAGAAAQPGAAPAEPDDAAMLTKDGAKKVEAVKREAAADAALKLGFDQDRRRVIALAHMLGAHIGWHQSNSRTKALPLNPDGTVDTLADADWRSYADEILALELTRDGVSMDRVERVGALLEAVPEWAVDRDALDMLKKPALEAVRKARHVGDYKTQKELKNALMRTGEPGSSTITLTRASLPALAWQPAPPQAGGDTALEDGEPDDEAMEEAA